MPTNEILDLYKKHGHIEYGERCTQLSHAVQAGLIAKEKGYDDELILASFLHDIGHLYPMEFGRKAFQTMGNFGMEAHDRWGEECLRKSGFSDRIIATVKNHVAAKRFLCSTDADYYGQLSEASMATLRYQGGPMTEEEVKAFKQAPFFDDSILIRLVDDEAKAEDFEVMEGHWGYFRELLERH